MSTTKRLEKNGRCVACRLRPFFDRLEARTALSATPFDGGFSFNPPGQPGTPTTMTPLGIESTTPASSSTLTSSPTALTVTFNKSLSGFSVGFLDFQLDRVNNDGTISALSGTEAQLLETLDASNASGEQIDLELTRPLVSGRYQLILKGSNQIAGIDGSLVADGGQDEIVSSFTISPPKSSLDQATNLGVVGPSLLNVPGTLDLAGNPGLVDYYKVELAPGHRWSLGIAVDSASLGSPLRTTLSLFDAQGKLVTTDSTGLQSDPNDPFLFAGLEPGTYYVGVSSQGNVPRSDGTYAPSLSTVQNPGAGSGGGVFKLQAVANPADQPTEVLGVRVDRSSGVSTGLTLQFSGGLQLAALEQPASPPLKLLDQNGQSWSVTTVGYDPATGQLRLVFNQELPEGTYTLALTGSNSLLDLADQVPMANGLPSGELARFPVTSSAANQANDLGLIFPGAQGSTSSLNASVVVAPQSSATRQFTVIEPGVYTVEGVAPSAGLSYQVTDASGKLLATGPQASASGATDVTLEDGSYTLTFVNSNGQSVVVPLNLLHKQTVFSELMEGGIAQGAALSLRLVTPQANFGSVTDPALGVSLSLAAPGPASSSTSASATPQNSIQTAENTGSNLLGAASSGSTSAISLLFGLGPVGLPSSQSNQISVVGSTGASGSLALASNSPGLTPGLIGIPESTSSRKGIPHFGRTASGREIPEEVPESEALGENPGVASTESGLLARTSQSRRADDRSLARAEWISQVFARTAGWVENISGKNTPQVEAGSVLSELASVPGEEATPNDPSVESASLASPIGVVALMAVVAHRFRKVFRFRGIRGMATSSNTKSQRHPIFLKNFRSQSPERVTS